MTAYVSIFVFAPIFLMTIEGSLPYRATLCFPEILLTLLLTSTAILAIFSMCPADHISIPLSTSRMEMDEAAIFFATISFLIIYAVSFYLCPPIFANPLIASLLLLIIFGYSFGWFFKKRLYRYPTGILRSFGYGFLIAGYIVTALGVFLPELSQILTGIIFFVLGILLIVISRRLGTTEPRRRPFPPDKTGIEYVR